MLVEFDRAAAAHLALALGGLLGEDVALVRAARLMPDARTLKRLAAPVWTSSWA